MALIERDHELDRLETALRIGATGRGSTVLIEGPPGIGKSALLTHACNAADGLGMAVLTASAAEFESGLGFGVVHTMFARALGDLDVQARGAALEGAARLALGPLGRRSPSDGALEPEAAFHGLYWLCSNLADKQPLLLAIDDLHWADEPSLAFLGYLARRAADHPVVVCATTRPVHQEPAERYLSALADESNEVLRPRPLSPAGVARLVTERLNAAVAPGFSEACVEASGGNPFLVQELLRAVTRHGAAEPVPPASLVELRTETLERRLLSRTARLHSSAAKVARTVAVLGPDADLRRVASLTGLDSDTVLEAVAGLRREGILASGPGLEFAHPLIRHTFYADFAEPGRGVAHLRAARMLDSDGDHARVASHLLHAEPNADPWVVERLRIDAATALSNGAPATAATLLRRALAEHGSQTEHQSLELDLGRALLRSGDTSGAADVLREALDHAHDAAFKAEIGIELGRALRLSGRISDALAVLDAAGESLQTEHQDHAMSIELEIAVAWQVGLPDAHWIERLTRVAAGAHGSTLPARAIRSMGALISAYTGGFDAAEVVRLARSSAAPDGAPDPPFMLQAIGAGLAMGGAFGEALDTLDRAIDICRQEGDAAQFGFVTLTHAWVAYRAGRVVEQLADAQAVLDAPSINQIYGNYAASNAIVALLERGALEEANRLLIAHGLDADSDVLETATGAVALSVRARLHQANGRLAEAVDDHNRCRDVLRRAGFTGPAFGEFREHHALACLLAGDSEAAAQIAGEYVDEAREYGAAREIGIALRTAGLVAGGPRGLELLAESVDVLEDSEATLDYAKSLTENGAALRRAGHKTLAVGQLRKGLDAASRCGGLATATRARDELVAAGARPRRDRLHGRDALTASELRVARMAAAGRSNPEIAQALFVTRRTVEVHLTHAYRKLGIQSRDALAAALADQPPD